MTSSTLVKAPLCNRFCISCSSSGLSSIIMKIYYETATRDVNSTLLSRRFRGSSGASAIGMIGRNGAFFLHSYLKRHQTVILCEIRPLQLASKQRITSLSSFCLFSIIGQPYTELRFDLPERQQKRTNKIFRKEFRRSSNNGH